MNIALTDIKFKRQWVAWRNEQRKGTLTKVPYAAPGRQARTNNCTTWLTYDRAAKVADKIVDGAGGGVGIVLGRVDDDCLAGVDLDSCRDPRTGQIAPWAQAILDRLDTYAEVSPSGTGVKAFLLIDLADIVELRRVMGTQHGRQFKRANGGRHPPAIEIYLLHRYFAVTWQALDDFPSELRLVPLDDLRWLLEEAGPAFASNDSPHRASREAISEEILARLNSSAASKRAIGTALRNAATMQGGSRSEGAFGLGAALRRAGWSFEDMKAALLACPATREWATEKLAEGDRQFERIWQKAGGEDKRSPGTTPPSTATEKSRLRRAPNLLTLAEYIEGLPHWAGAVRLNEFTQCIEVCDPFPPEEGGQPEPAIRSFREPGDVLEVVRWLQETGFAKKRWFGTF